MTRFADWNASNCSRDKNTGDQENLFGMPLGCDLVPPSVVDFYCSRSLSILNAHTHSQTSSHAHSSTPAHS